MVTEATADLRATERDSRQLPQRLPGRYIPVPTSELLRLPINDPPHGTYEVAATVRRGTDDQSPPILFINGMGVGQDTWGGVVDAFPDHTVITYDRAGLGNSDPRPRAAPCTYSDLASEAEQVVQAVCDHAPLICAHSLGGPIASVYADTFPIAGLVIVDGSQLTALKYAHAVLGFNDGVLPDSPLAEIPGAQHPDCTWVDTKKGAKELAGTRPSQKPTLALSRSAEWYWREGVEETQARERRLQIPGKHSNAYLEYQQELARLQAYERSLADGRYWTVHQMGLAYRLQSPYVGATVKADGAPVGHVIQVDHPAMVRRGIELVLAAVEGHRKVISDDAVRHAFASSTLNCVVLSKDQLQQMLKKVPPDMLSRFQMGEQPDNFPEWESVKKALAADPPFSSPDPQQRRSVRGDSVYGHALFSRTVIATKPKGPGRS